jgi:MFS family permease
LAGLLGWSIANPAWYLHLYLVFLLVGGATAGFQLAQFNLMLKLTPPGMGSLYIAVFLAVTSALAALGPLLGSALLAFTPLEVGNFLGHPFMNYHLLFLVSFLGCLLSLPILTSAHEPASKEIHHVWRSMWRMRSFNPLIALSTTAGLLLTPRGMLSLAYYSIRTVRRQFRRVVDVGTELLSGSQK